MGLQFVASYEPSPRVVRVIREQVAALAYEAGWDDDAVHDIRVAVSEAATNALIHGCRQSTKSRCIHVRAELVGGELRVDLTDEGGGMRPRPDSPGLGLGLPIMARLSKSVDICNAEPGTRITLAFGRPANAS